MIGDYETKERTEAGQTVYDVLVAGNKIGEIRNLAPDYPNPPSAPKIGYCFWPAAGPIGPANLRQIARIVEKIRRSRS